MTTIKNWKRATVRGGLPQLVRAQDETGGSRGRNTPDSLLTLIITHKPENISQQSCFSACVAYSQEILRNLAHPIDFSMMCARVIDTLYTSFWQHRDQGYMTTAEPSTCERCHREDRELYGCAYNHEVCAECVAGINAQDYWYCLDHAHLGTSPLRPLFSDVEVVV